MLVALADVWFTTSEDAEHTFEGLVRFFEAAGGVPKVARTDRMGALGRSQGRRFRLHPPALEFARHHGTEIRACQAGDAKRKGKAERPFRELKESFLTECDALGAPGSLVELNARGAVFLAERVHPRVHSTTGVAPAERLATERPCSGRCLGGASTPLTSAPAGCTPASRWSTGTGCPTRWSRPASARSSPAGWRSTLLSWSSAGATPRWPATCSSPAPPRRCGTPPVHRAAAEAIALAQHRPHLRLVGPAPEPAPATAPTPAALLELGPGDYDVDPPDLAARYGCGCQGAGA